MKQQYKNYIYFCIYNITFSVTSETSDFFLYSCKPCGLQFMFVFLLGRDDLWSLGSQSCLSKRYGDNKIHVSGWLCEFIAIHCYIPTYVSLLYIKPHIKCRNAVNNISTKNVTNNVKNIHVSIKALLKKGSYGCTFQSSIRSVSSYWAILFISKLFNLGCMMTLLSWSLCSVVCHIRE